MIEYLLRKELAARPADGLPRFVIHSAGTHGWAGAEMDPTAAAELRRLGGDPTDFRAKDLTVNDCETADLILTATADHRAYVLQEFPRALRRTFTLLEFAHLVTDVERLWTAYGEPTQLVREASLARGHARPANYDVVDPFGQAAGVHRMVSSTLSRATTDIARALGSDGLSPDR